MSNEIITVIATVASAVAAIAAVVVAYVVAKTQERVQENQLLQDLFDRRYAVYRAIEDLLISSLARRMGEFNQDEYIRFKYAVEPTEFLFGPEVVAYAKEIEGTTKRLAGIVGTKNQKAGLGQDATSEAREIMRIIGDVSGPFMQRRQELFRRYLKLQ